MRTGGRFLKSVRSFECIFGGAGVPFEFYENRPSETRLCVGLSTNFPTCDS